MNKRLVYGCVIVLVIGIAAALWLFREPPAATLPPTEEEISKLMSERLGNPVHENVVLEAISPDRKIRMAIGGMGLSDEEHAQINDLILVELSAFEGLELVERQSLDLALKELEISRSGLVRASDAIRVGQLVRADWFLLGTSVRVNETNSIIARLVDARSGIMLEAVSFPRDKSPGLVAGEIAGFVRQSREKASNPKPSIYLSVGSFQDVGLNDRQADLPRQLRSYLTAAFQNSDITLLEREFADVLLRELYLDLAGLTEGSTNNSARTMQSGYWMLDGYYQSYETKEFEVELMLNVRRAFGRNQKIALRDKPGEPLFKQARQTVERIIAQDNAAITPTRVTELKAQLEMGRDLSGFHKFWAADHIFTVWMDQKTPANEISRLKRNTEEAIRAFQTVLLLDPENREAKISLATCYRRPYIDRVDEARDYYREIIESTLEDRWSDTARRALNATFEWQGPETKLRWFAAAASSTSEGRADGYYNEQVKSAREEIALQQHGTPEAEKVAEERLLSDLRRWDKETGKGGYTVDSFTGLGKYVKAFGTNQTVAAARLVTLLPKLQKVAPRLAPHIQAGVVTFQTDTNAPIISEFLSTVRRFALHPEEISPAAERLPEYYFELLAGPVRYWSDEVKRHDITAEILAARESAFEKGYANALDREDKMALGYTYLKLEKWQKALEFFQSYSNRPVAMGNSGPWGKAFTPVLTSKHVAFCRAKLGLPPIEDPREFEMDTNCVRFYHLAAFRATDDGFWFCGSGELGRSDSAYKIDFTVKLPLDPSVKVNVIHENSTNLWIGTDGAGLFRFDKVTREVQPLRVSDGLLMDSVMSLHQTGDTLWVGYGSESPSAAGLPVSRGGLGKIDLKTGRIKSFSASLTTKSESANPTTNAIRTISSGAGTDLWILAANKLSKFDYSKEVWGGIPANRQGWFPSIATDHKQLIRHARTSDFEVELETRNTTSTATNIHRQALQLSVPELEALREKLKTSKTTRIISSSKKVLERDILIRQGFEDDSLKSICELPNVVTIMRFIGDDLWVGGCGFIALVDIDATTIQKLTYVPAEKIEDLQVGGGFLWARYNKQLHRVPLSDTR